MARIESAGAAGGSVLFDGRIAQIVGYDEDTVKLRFVNGEDGSDGSDDDASDPAAVVSVALADFVHRARVTAPAQGEGGPGPAPIVPWEPTGQRARHVRETLNGYARGRKAALHELERRAARAGS